MSIGYACIHIGSNKTGLSSLRIKNATDDNLRKVIGGNLNALNEIIGYNIINGIRLYRISSDIIPLGSHPANSLDWQGEFGKQLKSIGSRIIDSGMRVSMHPGQYTVLNSIHPDVVDRAIEDLEYHCDFLDSLGCDDSCKIILHIGGIYSDKEASLNRFIKNYKRLSGRLKRRLVIENDDKSYNVHDALRISDTTGVPVVFDNLHHELNHPSTDLSDSDWIEKCGYTWKSSDGKQKIHYSQKSLKDKRGAHSSLIYMDDFLCFYNDLPDKDVDIMLEVKDKNLSAVKCILLTKENLRIQEVEKEWSRYKYLVLSRSETIYKAIRELLKVKRNPDIKGFYRLIESALSFEEDKGNEVNAAQHIWGHVRKEATETEVRKFKRLIENYGDGTISVKTIKRFLYKIAIKQSEEYLLQSLYFYV